MSIYCRQGSGAFVVNKFLIFLLAASECYLHLLVEKGQLKYQNNMWNLFRVNNKDNNLSLTLNRFTHFSVSIVDFEQVIAFWKEVNLTTAAS